jgi:colicin import membrane protein
MKAQFLFVSLVLASSACGGSTEEGRKDLEAAAGAALNAKSDEATEKARAADEAKRKAAFEAKQKAEEEAKAKWDATLAEIITLPEKMPKSMDAACKELTEAYHEFTIKSLEADKDDEAILRWYNEEKRFTLGARRGKCVKIDSLEAAACQVHALRAAPPARGKDLEILTACVKKYAPEKAEMAAAHDAEELAQRTKKAEEAAAAAEQGG